MLKGIISKVSNILGLGLMHIPCFLRSVLSAKLLCSYVCLFHVEASVLVNEAEMPTI